MELVRLYTGTAAIVHFGKETIRPTNGWADVPGVLVPHLLKTGWSRNAPPPEAEPEDMKHALDVPEVAAIEGGDAIHLQGVTPLSNSTEVGNSPDFMVAP